jgi:DNA-binding NtrC family response regulator
VLTSPLDRSIRVLAIDDERAMLEFLETALQPAGCEVRTALSGARGRELFETWRPDVVLVDMLLPDADGLELLRRFKDLQPAAEVVVLTGHGTVAKAVEAMRAGAHSFIEKPVEPDALIALLARALEHRRLVGENRALKQQLEDRFQYGNVIGKSRKMLELLDLVKAVASSDANILIQGENGTGKELIANALHANSKRARGPFIKINCAALPKDLIESELFGYRKGAFTGAFADREGLLEAAEGGSLLLDEIGEMPAYLQTKLLRVLQDREYRPIGSDRVVRVDFRLICATNVDIDAALREGKLREDLYFRINTIALRVPPLRERVEDLPLLCEHFLAKYRRRHGRQVKGIVPAAYHLLIKHRWPGNVRELENAIERGVLVAKGAEVTVADLPEQVRAETPPAPAEFALPPGRTLAEIERMAIVQTLERTHWNKQEAAHTLGLYRPTLYSKLRKHGIQDPKQRRSGPEAPGAPGCTDRAVW